MRRGTCWVTPNSENDPMGHSSEFSVSVDAVRRAEGEQSAPFACPVPDPDPAHHLQPGDPPDVCNVPAAESPAPHTANGNLPSASSKRTSVELPAESSLPWEECFERRARGRLESRYAARDSSKGRFRLLVEGAWAISQRRRARPRRGGPSMTASGLRSRGYSILPTPTPMNGRLAGCSRTLKMVSVSAYRRERRIAVPVAAFWSSE